MSGTVPTSICYRIDESLDFEEIAASLTLAVLAVEAIHGEFEVRLNARHELDPEQHSCMIDVHTDVGRDLNKIFTGFLAREFAPGSFRVERVNPEAVSSLAFA